MESKAISEQHSLTEGPIWKGLLKFALPIFFGGVFQQLYNTADSIIVGNFLGKEQLAAVSSSGSLIFLLVGFFTGIAVGAGVVISRYFGARDYENVHKAVHTTIAFGIAAGIILTIAGVLLTPQILTWMGTPQDVLPNSVSYFRMYFAGALAVVMYNICGGILQAVGDSRHPLYYLIISSVLNVLLDLLFVGVFRWGVWAAALATTISQFVSVALCLARLMRYDTVYRLFPKKIRFHGNLLKQVIRFGIPSGVQNSVIAFANVIVQSQINRFSADAMAACGSYAKLEGYVFLPITAFTLALTTFVGQNLGAKQYDRTKKGVKFGISCSVIMAELIGVVLFFCAPYLIRLFTDDANVIAIGARQARIESLFFFLLAFSHCIAGIMRGAGKPTVPMVIMLVAWCVIRVSYLWVMVPRFLKIEVVFSAYPLTWSISSIAFLIYFLKSDWLHAYDRMKL
ncbi:MAG: MATE family efflux transporter [Oscillospiraceae bacterium]|jgi:putative MATE family efflux protein|nr:MATE family efflux transporter [Oscillospiraceae bacterium]